MTYRFDNNLKFIINKESKIRDSVKLSFYSNKKFDIFESKNFPLYEISTKNILNTQWAFLNTYEIFEKILLNIYNEKTKLAILLVHLMNTNNNINYFLSSILSRCSIIVILIRHCNVCHTFSFSMLNHSRCR